MKTMCFFLLMLFSDTILAQSINFTTQEKFIDSVFFSRINQYRTDNNLNKLSFNKDADSLTKSHNEYMSSCYCITHTELIKGKVIFPKERIGHSNLYSVENLVTCPFFKEIIKNDIHFNQFDAIIKFDSTSINNLVQMLFLEWINSINHNNNLLDKNIHMGSVSIKIDSDSETVVAGFIAFE